MAKQLFKGHQGTTAGGPNPKPLQDHALQLLQKVLLSISPNHTYRPCPCISYGLSCATGRLGGCDSFCEGRRGGGGCRSRGCWLRDDGGRLQDGGRHGLHLEFRNGGLQEKISTSIYLPYQNDVAPSTPAAQQGWHCFVHDMS